MSEPSCRLHRELNLPLVNFPIVVERTKLVSGLHGRFLELSDRLTVF